MKDLPNYTTVQDFKEISPDMIKNLQIKRQELRKKQTQLDSLLAEIFQHMTEAYRLIQEVEKI